MLDKLKVPSQTTRAYIYRVATAGLPLLVAYGALSENRAALWVSFAGALLVPGLAATHTPTKAPPPSE